LAGDTSDALGTLSLAAAIQPNSSLLFAETAALRFKAGLSESFPFDKKDDPAGLTHAVIAAHCQQIVHRPQNPDLHYRFGVLMMNVGRVADAIGSFQTALEINPAHTRAKSKLVVSLFEAHRRDEALEYLTGPDCLDKSTLELHYRTALLYCDRIKFASSLINLERHLEDNFASSDATVNISIILQNLGLLDRVTAMWENLTDTTNQAINAD
jgi:tetratricopeptide (TPR) repeat protein